MSLTANVSPCSGPCGAPSNSTRVSRQKAPSRSLAPISFIELMEHRLFVWTVSNSGPLVKSADDHRNLAGSRTDENLVLNGPTRMWRLGQEYPFFRVNHVLLGEPQNERRR